MQIAMPERWVLLPKPISQPRLRLFCCHPAGKGASIFVPWANMLPPDVDLACIQLPGRENRLFEPALPRMTTVIEQIEEHLFPYLDRPFCLFGASMGAWIAWELAHTLRALNHVTPRHLFVASARAPHLPERLPSLRQLSDEQFLDALQDRYHAIPEAIQQQPEMRDLFLPLLRADFNLAESYTAAAHAPLDCPITALGGAEDATVLPEELAGWQQYTSAVFQQRIFPGGHFFFYERAAQVMSYVSAMV